eukprot:TRINITY_DN42985_c0_g1_i1.p1 TRINITY_DN42985_c0_g1~~TRINITY_DN42985_c0_g1_i1.p1  ORF type:complete len:791 (+),score=190.93 TRINITY_DN42985_c0_g1_i1:34-2373(+)
MSGGDKAARDVIADAESSFTDHAAAYERNRVEYKAAGLVLMDNMMLESQSKLKVMLIAFHFKDFEFGETLLYHRAVGFDFVFVLMRALDAKRRQRSWSRTEGIIKGKESMEKGAESYDMVKLIDEYEKEERTRQHQEEELRKGKRRPAPSRSYPPEYHTAKRRRLDTKVTCDKPKWLVRRITKLRKLKKDLKWCADNVITEFNGSLSGNTCKRLREWAAAIPEETLHGYLLDFGLCLWKEFADAIHLNPASMKVPDFLKCVYDLKKARPEGVEYAMRLTKEDLEDIEKLKEMKPPVKYLAKRFTLAGLGDRVKEAVASYADLNSLVRKYGDLATEHVEEILVKRLTDGEEQLNLTVGKYIERLMLFFKLKSGLYYHFLEHAEEYFKNVSAVVDGPVVVLNSVKTYGSLIAYAVAAVGGEHNVKVRMVMESKTVTKPFYHPRFLKDVLTLSHFSVAEPKNGCVNDVLGLALDTCEAAKYLLMIVDGTLPYDAEKAKSQVDALHHQTHPVPPHVILVTMTDTPATQPDLAKTLKSAGFRVTALSISPTRPDPDVIDKVISILHHDTPSALSGERLVEALMPFCDLREIRDITYATQYSARYPAILAERAGPLVAATVTNEKTRWNRLPTKPEAEVFARAVEGYITGLDADGLVNELVEGKVEEGMGAWVTRPATQACEETSPLSYIKVNNDVLMQIFSFLGRQSLLQTANTCRSWRYHALLVAFNKDCVPESKYKAQMKQMVLFGFVRKHGYKNCLMVLRKFLGDTEASIDYLTLHNLKPN